MVEESVQKVVILKPQDTFEAVLAAFENPNHHMVIVPDVLDDSLFTDSVMSEPDIYIAVDRVLDGRGANKSEVEIMSMFHGLLSLSIEGELGNTFQVRKPQMLDLVYPAIGRMMIVEVNFFGPCTSESTKRMIGNAFDRPTNNA